MDFVEGLKILVRGTLDMIRTCHALKSLYLLNRQYWTFNLWIISKLWGCKDLRDLLGWHVQMGEKVGKWGGVTMSREKWSVPCHTRQHHSHLFFPHKSLTEGPVSTEWFHHLLFCRPFHHAWGCQWTRYRNKKLTSLTRSLLTPLLAT